MWADPRSVGGVAVRAELECSKRAETKEELKPVYSQLVQELEKCFSGGERFAAPDGGLRAFQIDKGTLVCHSACNIDPLSRGIGVQNWL